LGSYAPIYWAAALPPLVVVGKFYIVGVALLIMKKLGNDGDEASGATVEPKSLSGICIKMCDVDKLHWDKLYSLSRVIAKMPSHMRNRDVVLDDFNSVQWVSGLTEAYIEFFTDILGLNLKQEDRNWHRADLRWRHGLQSSLYAEVCGSCPKTAMPTFCDIIFPCYDDVMDGRRLMSA